MNKKHIIATAIEHPAILNVLKSLEQFGISHNCISVDPNGTMNFHEFENSIRDTTGLISVMLANNEVGTIQPIQEEVREPVKTRKVRGSNGKVKIVPVETATITIL